MFSGVQTDFPGSPELHAPGGMTNISLVNI